MAMTYLQIEATNALEHLDKHLDRIQNNMPLWAKGFRLAMNLFPGGSLYNNLERKMWTDYRMELLETIAGRRDTLPPWPVVE
jgi:hypothetical protein